MLLRSCFVFKSRFIEKFGTHVVVGVKMGGKDTVYMKQLYSSTVEPTLVQKQLKDIADQRFSYAPGSYGEVSKEKVCRIHSYVFALIEHFGTQIIKN